MPFVFREQSSGCKNIQLPLISSAWVIPQTTFSSLTTINAHFLHLFTIKIWFRCSFRSQTIIQSSLISFSYCEKSWCLTCNRKYCTIAKYNCISYISFCVCHVCLPFIFLNFPPFLEINFGHKSSS